MSDIQNALSQGKRQAASRDNGTDSIDLLEGDGDDFAAIRPDHGTASAPAALPSYSSSMAQEQQQYEQHLKLRELQKSIDRAQATNELLSRFTGIITDKAMHPHFLSLEMNSNGNGVSSSIKLNPERIQCGICKEWFFDLTAIRQHKNRLPNDCDECHECFSDPIQHVAYGSHTRCFVTGCASKERLDYGFAVVDIAKHVKNKHPQ